MVTNRVGIETTRPPQFILELADRRGGQTAAVTRDANTTVRAPNEKQVVNEAAFGRQRENYAKDIEGNPSLVQALAVAKFHPTPEGLVRVEQGINRNPTSWGQLVDAANTVTMTGGASPAANAALGRAMKDFVSAAGLRTTDTGDLAYLLARVMMKSDETERDDTLKRLKAALNAAETQLKKLEEQRRDLDNKSMVQPVQQGSDGKKDDGGGQTQNQISAAELAARDQERAQLDAQIENQRALVNDLATQINGMGTGNEQGSNQQLITEAILAMVEQAHAISQMTAPADTLEVVGTKPTQNQNGATT